MDEVQAIIEWFREKNYPAEDAISCIECLTSEPKSVEPLTDSALLADQILSLINWFHEHEYSEADALSCIQSVTEVVAS